MFRLITHHVDVIDGHLEFAGDKNILVNNKKRTMLIFIRLLTHNN